MHKWISWYLLTWSLLEHSFAAIAISCADISLFEIHKYASLWKRVPICCPFITFAMLSAEKPLQWKRYWYQYANLWQAKKELAISYLENETKHEKITESSCSWKLTILLSTKIVLWSKSNGLLAVESKCKAAIQPFFWLVKA